MKQQYKIPSTVHTANNQLQGDLNAFTYPRISVVVPTRNEEKNLHYVLPYIPENVFEVILVDGHSTDNTIEVAKQLRPDIRVLHQVRRGKGDALRMGFAASSGDIIVMIDADGSTDPKEIPTFIAALLDGHDFAKGSRYIKGGGSHDITLVRNLGNSGLSLLVNMLFGAKYSDLCYGYNAFWRHCLDHINIDCDGFEVETQINIRAKKAGLDIVEIPSMERPRIFGESNLRAWRDGLRILKMIMKERMTTEQVTHHNVPILMYHSISEQATPRFKQFTVPQKVFAEQMEFLHTHGYTPITTTQYIQAKQQNYVGLPARPVIITFDDGFADFYSAALPILQQYGFSATLYVTTAYINGTSRWLQHEGEGERPMLTWEQLKEISDLGIECGGHSHTHPQLDTLTVAQARDEIIRNKQLLEEHLGRSITSFAYPFGYHTANIRKQVQEAGYTTACAVKHAMSTDATDPFALARWTVYPDTSLSDLDALLVGKHAMTFSTLYKRARTPVWQLARRSSATMARRFQGGLATR
jgi:peptidoglycan/xylan/chitin deacetylase (PgdA/CDA1 family)